MAEKATQAHEERSLGKMQAKTRDAEARKQAEDEDNDRELRIAELQRQVDDKVRSPH